MALVVGHFIMRPSNTAILGSVAWVEPRIHSSGKFRVSSFPTVSNSTIAQEPFAIHLIREGMWREAVYLYREETGVSMAQAEHAIEKLALECGVHRYSRYFFVGMIAMSGISVVLLAGIVKWLS